MANDLRLPFDADPADAGALPVPVSTGWSIQTHGAAEFRRKPFPWQMRGSFDSTGNRMTMPYMIRSTDFFKAIPCILGWSTTTGAPAGGLLRRLPIHDEQGMGMVATRISSYRFIGSSRLKPGKDLHMRQPSANDDPTLPPAYPTLDDLATTPDLFKDDNYKGTDVFDFDTIPSNGDGLRVQYAIKQTRYCILNVEFAHVPYRIETDTTIQSGGNYFGANDERLRYMWTEFSPSVEYTTSKAITLNFASTASAGLANTPCGSEAGYLRPTGELTVHWEKIPANAVAALFDKFEDNNAAAAADRGPRYGMVNDRDFAVVLFGYPKIYPSETMMFMNCRSELRYQPHGPIEYNLHYTFQYRYGGWNNFLTPRSPILEPVVRQDGTPPYLSTDFAELFKAA